MAICTACGAASAAGAEHCASCGEPFAVPAIGEVAEVLPEGAEPTGSWGRGRVYDPTDGRGPAVRWLLSTDWFGPLLALAAPTALLMGVTLLLALPEGTTDRTTPYGTRLVGALAQTLTAFGAPLHGASARESWLTADVTVRVVPLSITVLWLVALWLGLRLARRRTTGELTLGQAAGMAARTAVPAGLITVALGLVAAGGHGEGAGLYLGGARVEQVGWPQAAGWTVPVSGLLALTVYGTDALRWAAWRQPAVRGWLLGGLLAVRAVAIPLGLASVAAGVAGFVVAANRAWRWLPELPNYGLFLIGIGSGAGLESHGSLRDESISLLHLNGAPALLWLSVLLPVLGALVLGLSAHRRALSRADRLRLAAVHTVLLSLLMLVAGSAMTFRYGTQSVTPGADGPLVGTKVSEATLGLGVVGVLVADLLWSALGALGVAAVLDAVRRPVSAPEPAGHAPEDPEDSFVESTPPSGHSPGAVEILDSHPSRRP